VNTNTQSTEVRLKFEAEVRTLSTKVKDLSEQVFELENQLKDEESNQTMGKQEMSKR